MKKYMMILMLGGAAILGGCSRCEVEPIVEENQKLIVPPNFGKTPAANKK